MSLSVDPKVLSTLAPKFSHRVVARFQDVDAAKIVFFARVLDYFHDTFVAFLAERGLPLESVLARGEWGMPIRRAQADYLAPIAFADELDVAIVGAEVAGSDLTVAYCARLRTSTYAKPGVVAAVGHTRHVVVAGGLGAAKRRDAPADLVAAFASVSADPVV